MIDTPRITQSAAQRTAVIRLIVPRREIRNVMGPGIRELTAAVAAQGIAAAAPLHAPIADGPGMAERLSKIPVRDGRFGPYWWIDENGQPSESFADYAAPF